MSPITGRLPRSRSPPQPNTTTRRPLRIGLGHEHGLQRIGGVGVIHKDRGAGAGGWQPAPGGLVAAEGFERPVATISSAPVPITRPAAISAFDAWKVPAKGKIDIVHGMAGADLPELLAKTVGDLAEEAQMLAPGADGVDDQAMVAGGDSEVGEVRRVGIDDRGRRPGTAHGEEHELGRGVVLHSVG